MDYSKQTCNRELAEEMQRLNICQDGAELIYFHSLNGEWKLAAIPEFVEHTEYVIAPTLTRMMEELPFCEAKELVIGRAIDGDWYVLRNTQAPFGDHWYDKHLPNAVARALIAIKKGQ